ncbi:MAG TPA: DnaD domain protein [Ktedonobacterales bacterium]|nr:DnaD domain protein [Ktedonobacterales bacterium]
MPAFPGFPPGETPYTPLPEAFFTALLPEIEDVGELKVTLHLYWLLYQKQGSPRCASDRELLADPQLRRALRRLGDPRPYEERLRVALEMAHARGVLLRARVRVDGEIVTWYFFNTEKSRRAVARLLEGTLSPAILLELEGPLAALNPPADIPAADVSQEQGATEDTDAGDSADPDEAARQGLGYGETRPGMLAPLPPALSAGAQGHPRYQSLRVEVERPNIYALYEQNIGLLLPLVAEELREAEEQYPWEWVEAAFREAVQQNKRKWSYIRAILKRWEVEGKGGEPYGAHGRYSR